jgi:hypothetical protein
MSGAGGCVMAEYEWIDEQQNHEMWVEMLREIYREWVQTGDTYTTMMVIGSLLGEVNREQT